MCESSRPDHIPSTQRCHPEAPSQQGVSSGGGPAAMPLSRLDHVNLRTAELAAMQTFYSEVLGMSLGPRPPFSFDGAWLYCGGQATVQTGRASGRERGCQYVYMPDGAVLIKKK